MADVLAGEDDHATGEEPWILSPVEHVDQPGDGLVGVGVPHPLDERAGRVVVGTGAVALVARSEGGADVLDADLVEAGRDGHGSGDVEDPQQLAAIAVGRGDRDVGGVVADRQPQRRRGSTGQLGQVVPIERLELEHGAPAEQRADDGGPRALGGRSDQRDDARLDRWQERVLLGAGESMDLVEEEDRPPLVHPEARRRLLDRLADVLHGRRDRRQRDIDVVACRGHQAGDGGLPRPR